MKAKIKEIPDYREGGEKILRLRDDVKDLDAQEPASLRAAVENFEFLLGAADPEDKKMTGTANCFSDVPAMNWIATRMRLFT